MKPIDVVIPVYKAANWITAAVESCLQPEVGRVIVVDDASPDETPTICRQLARKDKRIVALLLGKNGGQYVASNTGFQYLRPEAQFVGMQDADDVAHPERFKNTLEFFLERPDLDIIGGRMESIREDGTHSDTTSASKQNSYENPDDPHPILSRRYGHVLTNGVMTMRRRVIDSLRGYEPSYGGSDTQFIIRAHYAGFKMWNLNNKVLGYRRIHGNQCTKNAMLDRARNAYRQKQAGEWLWWQEMEKRGRLDIHYLQALPVTGRIKEVVDDHSKMLYSDTI